MDPSLGNALNTYAQQAARNWGTAPDETFVQAHRQALQRHQEGSPVNEIALSCLAMNDGLPGRLGHTGTTEEHSTTMYFGFESDQALPPHLGGQVTLDVLAAVTVQRRQGFRGRNDELYTALNYTQDKKGTPIGDPQLLGVEGKRVARNKYGYSATELARAAGLVIIKGMTALSISFAAKARLPGAPYEMLQCGLQLSVIGEENARGHIAQSARDTTQARLAMEKAGVPVTAANVGAYYQAAFRHDALTEDAIHPRVRPLAEATHPFEFHHFRARCKRAAELLHFLGGQSRIVELPDDKPDALF